MLTFSIITVTYNDCKGLEETYLSVSDQIYKDYEWIVIDGASNDDTVEFLTSIKSVKNKWISEKDTGIYDAMNKGIKLAVGQYLVFLNAGDLFPDIYTLNKIASNIISKEIVPDVIMGGATFLLPNGIKMRKIPRKVEDYIWHGVPANHQATYYRYTAIKDLLYDTRYKICGDYYIIAMMFVKKMNFSYFNEPLVDFKVGGASYKRFILLWKESYQIKIQVLQLPLFLRCKSLIKSIVSTLGLIILSQPTFSWLGKLLLKLQK